MFGDSLFSTVEFSSTSTSTPTVDQTLWAPKCPESDMFIKIDKEINQQYRGSTCQ